MKRGGCQLFSIDAYMRDQLTIDANRMAAYMRDQLAAALGRPALILC